MDVRRIIYTYGSKKLNARELIGRISVHNVDCVLDCRPDAQSCMLPDTTVGELRKLLHRHGIYYIPFYLHFGRYPQEVRNKQGDVVYKKAIAHNDFLKGVERVEQGIREGHTICLIDHVDDVFQSVRFSVVGKFLSTNYRVWHLSNSGFSYTQEELENKKETQERSRQKNNQAAQTIGQTGEELAALYLMRRGYQIMQHNWNLHRGCELDLVARKDDVVHFIEVKTRSSDKYGEPQIAIDHRKMLNIIKAVQHFCGQYGIRRTPHQIDSIAIIYRADDDYDLKHFLDIRSDGSACDCDTFQQRPHE